MHNGLTKREGRSQRYNMGGGGGLRQRDETKRGLHNTARKMVKGNLNVILRLGTNNKMTKHAFFLQTNTVSI